MNAKILFKPEEEGINNVINTIKNFGEIYLDNYNKYAFRNCPLDAKDEIKYTISGDKNNIFTKIRNNENWMGTICINELDKSIEEHTWKIQIVQTQFSLIMVGVAPFDFDFNSKYHYGSCGWYYNWYNSKLYSGPPYYYNNENSGLSKANKNLIIKFNMKKRTIKFIVNDEDKGDSYVNIPIDRPIFPAVLLYNQNDSIEITECN